MRTFYIWSRGLLAATVLLHCSPAALAARATSNHPTTELSQSQHREPTGNPVLGVLIIIGLVALLIFVAWLFSRIGGDGSNRHMDTSIN